jgi:hypothetical protein
MQVVQIGDDKEDPDADKKEKTRGLGERRQSITNATVMLFTRWVEIPIR